MYRLIINICNILNPVIYKINLFFKLFFMLSRIFLAPLILLNILQNYSYTCKMFSLFEWANIPDMLQTMWTVLALLQHWYMHWGAIYLKWLVCWTFWQAIGASRLTWVSYGRFEMIYSTLCMHGCWIVIFPVVFLYMNN